MEPTAPPASFSPPWCSLQPRDWRSRGQSGPKAGASGPGGEPSNARRTERVAFDEVRKVLPRWERVLAVVAPDVGACLGVQQADRVDLGHALSDLFRGERLDCGRLIGRALRASGGVAPKGHGDDAAARVLVDARELVDLDVDASLFPDLAAAPSSRGPV